MVHANGIRMRIAEEGDPTKPLVLLMHGWPEFWYSWRAQLAALASAGFYAVAPDLRGFGATEAPLEVAAFDCECIGNDMLALLKVLGHSCYALVGHDWGAILAWHLGCLFPEAFPRLCVMSVPPVTLVAKVPPVDRMAQQYGEDFWYILYHNEYQDYGKPWPIDDPTALTGPAEKEYDADVEGFLKRLYLSGALSTSEVKAMTIEAPPCQDPKRSAGGQLDRLPLCTSLPSWMPQEALDRFVEAFKASGFRGGINYYRCLNRNWQKTKSAFQKAGGKIKQPTLFIGGELDPVIKTYGGPEATARMVSKVCSDLRGCCFIADCGHWNTQEKPHETTQALLRFLENTRDLGDLRDLDLSGRSRL